MPTSFHQLVMYPQVEQATNASLGLQVEEVEVVPTVVVLGQWQGQ